ncbi:hypothetical protein [Aquimarina agarivorans]|uniref:hypothetical protein n=1 Tax=Aquimarina agarivorans TaxID=980584 RepID=UPI000248F87B|nr:hypothetical protein [Aquimarina agarivorans]
MKTNKHFLVFLIFLVNISYSQTNCENLIESIIPKSLRNYEKTNKEISDLKKGDFVFISLSNEIQQSNEKWKNWIKYTDGWKPNNPAIFELVINNGQWLERKAIFINPKSISNLRLEVLYNNKSTPKSSAFKDENGNIYGYLEHKKFKKTSFTNKDAETDLKNLKSNFKIDDFIVFDEVSVKMNSYHYYKVIDLDISIDRPRLILKEYNSKTNTPSNDTFEVDCRTIKNVYMKSCYQIAWNEEKNKYDSYLKANFSSKEIKAILSSKVDIGMSEKALYESIGKPRETNMQQGNGYVLKQLVYGSGIFVYVKNSKVTSYQNIESLRGF